MTKVPRAGRNLTLFDTSPITVGSFRFTAHEASPVGHPSKQDWQEAYIFASNAQESSPYWVADLLEYAHQQGAWKPFLDQLLSTTGLDIKTVYNHHSVGTKVKPEARSLAPTFTHARVVAKLEDSEQVAWLDRARTEGWSSRELEVNVRQSKRRKVIEGQAELAGQYRVWLVDCPWSPAHRDGMTIRQLCELPVAAHAAKNAVMFFWVTAPFLYYASDGQTPDSYRIIRAWGFEPKTGMVWDKVDHNFGNYVSVRHEHLLICTRGICTPDRPTPMYDSVFTERSPSDDGSKPKSVYAMIERLYDGPRIELFARESREGWASFGDDAAVWTRSA